MNTTQKSLKQQHILDENRSPIRVIWFLAWPVIMDQSLQTMVHYIDSAMVGALGATATAAIAVSSSTIWLLNGTMNAFGAAFGVSTARHIGAKSPKDAQHVVRQAFIAIALFSLVVTTSMSILAPKLPLWLGVASDVAPDAILYIRLIFAAYPFTILFIYMSNLIRSSGDTKSPLICNIITNVVNIIANFLLIFPSRTILILGKEFSIIGAGWGVRGAAIATVGATIFSSLLLFGVLLFKRSSIQISLSSLTWKIDKTVWKTIGKVGFPLALERITLSVGQIVLTFLVTRIGTVALAAHHLAITAESITYMPVSGFSIAATTLVAQSLGAQNKELAKKFARTCLYGGVILMSFMGVFLFLFSRQLMTFFTFDNDVILLGARVLRIESFAQPFFAMAIVIGGILRGGGDTRWPFYYSLIGMWCVRLLPASILILYGGFGLEAAWICMVADLVVRGILNGIRFKKGTWLTAWKE